jgi:alpha-glucosidase
MNSARASVRLGFVLAAAAVASPAVQGAPSRLSLTSPDGKVAIAVQVEGPERALVWSATLDGKPLIERSSMGIRIDGIDLSRGVDIRSIERYNVDDRYPWNGVHSTAVDRSRGARVTLLHAESRTTLVADVRAANDAVAFRFMAEGSGRRVPDAASGFRLPAGSVVWSHGLRDHYEALYERRTIEQIPAGDWAAPPVTFKLPRDAGFAAITESDLRDYAGMALQSDGARTLVERLAHDHPPGYPYTLRFGEDNAKRLTTAATVTGTIRTPWRIVMVGRTLHALVNSDAVHNLAPPPDPKLFPEGIRTPWIKPGRAVWRYLDGGESTPEGIKEFSRMAAELGFEYQVIEGQWAKWTDDQLREVVEYSSQRGVGLLVWRHRRTLEDPAERRKLFASLQQAGIAGLKVDFLDHEAKEVIDLYQAILRDAAEHKLLVNFHGSNKPAGESRTWPNELTREGIYGMEHKSIKAWAAFNTTFPFARMLAGHADYTPVVFGERRRETSWAHQIASAAILTSPLLVYGGNPASLLANPAADVIKSIPSTWDETIVLPPSDIGALALFARRKGTTWFVAAMNGPDARTIAIELKFLGPDVYHAVTVRDRPDDPAAVDIGSSDMRKGQRVDVAMRAGGGFVLRLTK